MSLIDWVPGVRTLELAALATVVTVVGGVYVKQRIEVATAHRHEAAAVVALAVEKDAHAHDLAVLRATADNATIANQTETIRRIEVQKETDNETQRLETRARDAAVRAAASDGGLRDAFARTPATPGDSGGPGHSGSIAFRSPIAPADVVRADVFGRADDAAGDLALAFDIARTRGLACQRQYESLTAAKGAP